MARIALVGDFDESVPAHRAIPIALGLAAQSTGVPVHFAWLPTEEIDCEQRLADYDAFWCVPASPYRSMDGALLAIRHARERGRPFLGTCGGFQHAVIEYARNVLGWHDAEHAETAPEATRLVISPLVCALVEKTGGVRFAPGSRLHDAYGRDGSTEGYHCSYGMNRERQAHLIGGALRASAWDEAGDVRGLELDGHPFFVMTLFQPERAALRGALPPVVRAFVEALALQAAPDARAAP